MAPPPETRAAAHPVVAALRTALAAHGDPATGRAQQAYMKSALPFHGITAPALRRLVREVAGSAPFPDSRAAWEAAIRELYDQAAYREERYAAELLAQDPRARGWQDPETLPLYAHLIRTGAWWDHVDRVTTGSIAPILAAHRATVTPTMRSWALADDLWVRRAAILCQLPHRDATDTDLLAETIERNGAGTAYGQEFFVRKAIGWALRQYARTDPGWVRAFVASHEDRLCGLSRREALKHL